MSETPVIHIILSRTVRDQNVDGFGAFFVQRSCGEYERIAGINHVVYKDSHLTK